LFKKERPTVLKNDFVEKVLALKVQTKIKKVFFVILCLVAIVPVFTLVQIILSGSNAISNNSLVFSGMVLAYCISSLVVVLYAYKKIEYQYVWCAVFGMIFFGAVWCIFALSLLGSTE